MALAPSPNASPRSLRRKRGGVRGIYESGIKLFCGLCAIISIFTTAGIVWTLLKDASSFFAKVSVTRFLTETEWSPVIGEKYGILPLLNGTMMIAAGSAIIAVPLGLLIAVYLSEYASPKARNLLKPALELLAGIPTVVYGFFGVFVITPMLQKAIPGVQVFNALSGAIVVGVMILPLVASLCEDAIAAVPKAMREGAYGLGSTKREVILKIVIPAALSGIIASFILAISRAIGETMAVTLAAGSNPRLSFDPRESIQTMTAYIVQVSKGDNPAGTTSYYSLYAVGFTLFVITLGMNILANYLVRRFRQAY